jgi:phage baseplate assembly protein W
MDIAFPFTLNSAGATATAEYADHVRHLIELLLFTSAGERVNRPDFGSGLLQLVFAPNSPELAAALQFSVAAALQRWLGDVIGVEDLTVEADGSTLRIRVQYVLLRTGQREVANLVYGPP